MTSGRWRRSGSATSSTAWWWRRWVSPSLWAHAGWGDHLALGPSDPCFCHCRCRCSQVRACPTVVMTMRTSMMTHMMATRWAPMMLTLMMSSSAAGEATGQVECGIPGAEWLSGPRGSPIAPCLYRWGNQGPDLMNQGPNPGLLTPSPVLSPTPVTPLAGWSNPPSVGSH